MRPIPESQLSLTVNQANFNFRKFRSMTQKELIIQYLNDEQLKVDSITWDEAGIGVLEARLKEFENLAIEIRSKATVVSKGLRERKLKLGKGLWDKGTLPMENIKVTRKIGEKELSKFEKGVKTFIDSGYDDLDLIEFYGEKKEKEVRAAISRIRGIETPGRL